jgi:hypothetical protein
MSWTDIFLIPFKIAQDRFKAQNPLIRCKSMDEEVSEESSSTDIEVCPFRIELMDICKKSLWGCTDEVLKSMMFGANYDEYEDIMLDTLKEFKSEDSQTTVVDTLDKLIIDEIIRRLENQNNSSESIFSPN